MKIVFLYSTLILGVLLCLASCKEENLPLAEIIHFTNSDEESLVADNSTTLKITAVIPRDATATNRSVQFKTDLGQFSNNTNAIAETANSDGEATVYFHSDKIGKATITATVSTFSITKTVNCTQVDLSSLIRFDNFNADPMVADNVTTRTVRVVIDKNNTPQDKRQVILTTDLGTFTNQQSTITLLADADGSINTAIKSDAPGTANIVASNNGFSTSTTLKFIAPDPNSIVRFDDGLTSSVPADGVTGLELRAVINNNIQGSARSVAFATDKGTFSNDQSTQAVAPNESGISTTYLKSAVEGTATVSITHRNLTRTRTFNFTRAYPDNMSIASDFVLKAGATNKISIQVQLNRAIGKASPNFQIDYTAFDGSNNPIGQFNSVVASNANGQASVDFSALATSYRGAITIQAKVREKPEVSATTKVTVTD